MPLVHLFFVHSPITYSIARDTIAALQLEHPILIGARGISGPGFVETVADDGQWSVLESCQTLQCLLRHVPPDAQLALYVPHTAFLLGKLLRASSRVARLYYLEEGLTSADASQQQPYQQPAPVDIAALLVTMERLDLLATAGIAVGALCGINAMSTRPHPPL